MVKLGNMRVLQNNDQFVHIPNNSDYYFFIFDNVLYISCNNKHYIINNNYEYNFNIDEFIKQILLRNTLIYTNRHTVGLLLQNERILKNLYGNLKNIILIESVLYLDDTIKEDYYFNNIVVKNIELIQRFKKLSIQKLNPSTVLFYSRVYIILTYLQKQFKIPTFNNKLIQSNLDLVRSTGRPTNNINKINFLALNKSDGSRDIIEARSKHILVQFDYHAYHLYLISVIFGYKLPDNINNIYKHIQSIIMRQQIISLEEVKVMVFKQLYSVQKNNLLYNALAIFNNIEQFKDDLYQRYKEQGYINTLIGDKKIISCTNKSHLFNIYIQNLESQFNYVLIADLIKYIQINKLNNKVRLVLYQYDSFLFQIHNDYIDQINKLKQIIQNQELFKTKINVGKLYSQMQNL